MDDKVIINVQSKYYEVSKRKLSAKSSYFKSMFTGDFLEKNKPIIKLQGISSDAWEEILYYVDTGRLRAKTFSEYLHREILNLLQAADMLQFNDVREGSLRAAYDILDPENSLEILEAASRLDLEDLIQKSRALALWYSDRVTLTDIFHGLRPQQAEGYLSDPGLHSFTGERGVWNAINRWLNAGMGYRIRGKFLPQLIKCLCIKDLSLPDLKAISENHIVKSTEIVYGAVKRLIVEKGGEPPNDTIENLEDDPTEKEQEIEKFLETWRAMPPRKIPLVPAIIAKLNKNTGITTPYIVRFSEEEGKFIPVLRLDEVETCLSTIVGFKVISYGSKLYMLGGEIMTRQVSWYFAVWEYDQILRQWMFVANLRKEIRHASLCVFGDELFVMGGFGRHRLIQDTVSKLSLRTRSWSLCAPLPRPMYSVPSCVFKGHIYAIQTEIYQYSPRRDTWRILDNIRIPRGEVFSNALTDGEHIFVSGLRRAVYKFDPTADDIKLEVVGNFQWECSQACLVGDYIYSMSQIDFDYELYCERMNIKTGECVTLWKGTSGSEIGTFSPNHHHGCFPLLLY